MKIVEVGLDEGFVFHLLDIGAGGEGALAPRQHDRADAFIGLETIQGLRQLLNQLGGKRVQGLRAIETDEADRPSRFDDHCLSGHERPSCGALRGKRGYFGASEYRTVTEPSLPRTSMVRRSPSRR